MKGTSDLRRQVYLEGWLESVFDGAQGHIWCFRAADAPAAAPHRRLKTGDILLVFNDKARGGLVWQGVVDLDFQSHIRPQPPGIDIRMQWIQNIGSVCGIQRRCDPDNWARMFREERPAFLIARG